MKKSLITLLVLGLISCALFVSCNSEVTASQGDSKDLVSVSFDGGDSKSLTATLEGFDKNAYYWKYAARKNVSDTSGLTSGETASYDEDGAVFIHEATPGLTGKVSGFSQGVWDFKLFAYKRSGAGTNASPYVYTHVYTGEATGVTLKKGSENLVTVTVSPYSTGTGTLFIGSTSLTPKTSTNVPSVSRYLKVQSVGSAEEKLPTSGTTYTLDAGAYLVTVTYKSNDVVFAEGTVIATVYPNLTTTVGGSVDELITYAQFDAELNPDIITKTAGLDGITSTTQGDDEGNIKLTEASTVEDKKVEATVPAAAAVALLPKDGDVPDPNASMSLALNVDTVDSTSTSVTYEISMTKVVTLNSEVSTSDVTTLGTYTEGTETKKYYAVATIKLSTGLTGVSVTHDGYDMVNSADTAEDAGYGVYSYDADSGILTIQTNTFSPFAVTYDGLSFGVAEVNGVKYSTLEAAVTAAQANDTVKLLCDTEGSGMSISKAITIDLNGKTYTGTKDPAGSAGTKTQLFQLLAGTTVTIKNGTLTSTADSGIKRIIQNYTDLTLDSVVVDGSNIGSGQYVCSFNCGNVNIKGATSFKIPENGVAFDSYYWPNGGYSAGVSVEIDTTGTIGGIIELDADGTYETYGNSITIKNGVFTGSLNVVKGSLEIQGGSFKYDPWKYVKDGYEAIFNTATNMWDVKELGDSVAKINTTYYSSLQAAIDAAGTNDKVELLRNITISSVGGNDGDKYFGLYINAKSITVDGHFHEVKTDKKGLRALVGIKGNSDGISVSFDNISIISGSVCSKAIETRGNIKSISVKNSLLDSSNYTSGSFDNYVQALTIGGYNTPDGSVEKTDVTIDCSTIKTSDDGSVYYAIMLWNPVEMTVFKSDIRGWTNFYFKEGSSGSTVTVNDSELTSKGRDGQTNTFGLVVFEDTSNKVIIKDTNIQVSSNAVSSKQAIVMFSEWYGPNTGNSVDISGGAIAMEGNSAIDLVENGYENSLIIKDAKGHSDLDYHSPKVEVALMYIYDNKELCYGGFLFSDIFNLLISDKKWMILTDSVSLSEDKILYVDENATIGVICGDYSISNSDNFHIVVTPLTAVDEEYYDAGSNCVIASDKDISGILSVPEGYSCNSISTIPSFTQGFKYAWEVSKNQ